MAVIAIAVMAVAAMLARIVAAIATVTVIAVTVSVVAIITTAVVVAIPAVVAVTIMAAAVVPGHGRCSSHRCDEDERQGGLECVAHGAYLLKGGTCSEYLPAALNHILPEWLT
jgi:hypothetical protein